MAGTPFDFRTPTAIGARINQDNEQLKFGKGYDHNWVFNKHIGDLTTLARVTEPTTGRVLEVLSTEPGLQFYSGNFLDGTIHGQRRQGLQFPRRLLHGAAAFSRFSESPHLPVGRAQTGPDL